MYQKLKALRTIVPTERFCDDADYGNQLRAGIMLAGQIGLSRSDNLSSLFYPPPLNGKHINMSNLRISRRLLCSIQH